MTARFLIGDVRERMAELPDGSFDLILCSPPFLALRSYLPAGHPDKAREIGSEATPAEFLAVLLELTVEWGRLLAPHGSIAVELGDTYAGSGGGGGDYYDGGLRAGQPGFTGSAAAPRDALREANARHWREENARRGEWPLDKSLCGIPTLYAWSLAYGRNLLTGEPSPAGMWRVRNVKPWIRSNPPVGALGDKERPATSYVVVATRARDRYFDLDAVRTGASGYERPNGAARAAAPGQKPRGCLDTTNAAGAPPRDWWHHVDAVIDAVIDDMAAHAGDPVKVTLGGKDQSGKRGGGWHDGKPERHESRSGARGVHIRRGLERAGILHTLDAIDVSPKGYAGAHYAVWPKELVRLLVDEMCPHRVCTTCSQPSRRIIAPFTLDSYRASTRPQTRKAVALADEHGLTDEHIAAIRAFGTSDAGKAPTLNNGAGKNTDEVKRLATEAKAVLGGYFREFVQTTTAERTSTWSDCGCPGDDRWRPGRILDPFVGSGTTLEVATGMGRDAVGIDIDMRNALLALERVGPLLLDIDWPHPNYELPTLLAGSPHPADYDRWARRTGDAGRRVRHVNGHDDEPPAPWHPGIPEPDEAQPVEMPRRPVRAIPVLAGQGAMFDEPAEVPA